MTDTLTIAALNRVADQHWARMLPAGRGGGAS